METINYYNGQTIIPVVVTHLVAEAYRQMKRDEWRISKREARYHARMSPNQFDDESECFVDISASDPLEILIEREDREERRVKLNMLLQSLTSEQTILVKMLKRGMAVTEIAAKFDVDKSAISHMRKRIQNKVEKYL